MKQLCLISPAFAFPIGERGLYFPHGELAKALEKRGIKTTVICLGPNITRDEGSASVHAVPIGQANGGMLASWMPSNSYYLSAASALWQKYIELSAKQSFDLLDVPAYLPFDPASIARNTALVVRAYNHELDGIKQNGGGFPVDRIMMENMQALALLQADAVLVDEQADAQTNRWATKLRHTFTARLMSELEASVFSDEKAILPRNDLATIMIGSSAADAAWSVTCLRAMTEFLSSHDNVRFLMPIFQRQLNSEEMQLIQTLKSTLAATNRLDRLYLIRPLAINKLNGCLKSVDAVIAPDKDSGLPCIGMEALAEAKPIIVHRSNPLATFTKLHNCGFVIEPQQDSSQISEQAQLCAAFEQALLAADAGARGKQAARTLFDEYVNTSFHCYVAAMDAHHQSSNDARAHNNMVTNGASGNTHPQFLAACDRMLYDVHYKTSLRFRVKHWINRLSQSRRHLHKP
jgi:hypothetical protein